MLFDPSRHEPLQAAAWDEARVRAGIRAMVAAIEDAMGGDGTWPWHPLDDPSRGEPPHKSLYLGAAGVLWALWRLARAGAVTLRVDPASLIDSVHAAYLARPDTGAIVPSYFLGEAGILLVQWRLTRARAAADRLHEVVTGNARHPANELLWGAPGTMMAALHMHRWTGEARWREAWLASAEQVWRAWGGDEHAPLWTQDLYGERVRYVGAAHGFAGNAGALLRGAALLDDQRREALHERCARTLRATARVEDDGANWPPSLDERGTKRLMQWCHGAPGIVTSFAAFPAGRSADVDDLLVRAGRATWRAGPLAKGPGLCHGTAGNGCAFLTLYRRTGDATWLAHARAFAMHALAQAERLHEEHGRLRCTLWTGDAGVALYLAQCVDGQEGLPGLDVTEQA